MDRLSEPVDRPLVACVLAGGTGTRLYPASRSHRPKQFLALEGDRSLLERTVDRVGVADERYVLTRERFADGVRDRVPEAGVLVEPAGKDTGPALVYAAWRLREQVGDCVLVSLPSDHRVGDDEAFAAAIERAARAAAETGGLVTLGVEPARPATAFGYVVPERDGTGATAGIRPVSTFREKPDRETATALLERGAYWNAGIFAWTPDALLCEARESRLAPLVEALEDGEPAAGFDAIDPVSVDYAIMERADEAYVVPLSTPWDDLGTWDALGRVLDGEADNATLEGTDALAIDAEENVVAAPDHHVSLVGVDGLVVAVYDDRVLVVPRTASGRVRDAVSRLREEARF